MAAVVSRQSSVFSPKSSVFSPKSSVFSPKSSVGKSRSSVSLGFQPASVFSQSPFTDCVQAKTGKGTSHAHQPIMAKCVEELDVYQKAMDASAQVSAIIQRDSFRRDPRLRDQLGSSSE